AILHRHAFRALDVDPELGAPALRQQLQPPQLAAERLHRGSEQAFDLFFASVQMPPTGSLVQRLESPTSPAERARVEKKMGEPPFLPGRLHPLLRVISRMWALADDAHATHRYEAATSRMLRRVSGNTWGDCPR